MAGVSLLASTTMSEYWVSHKKYYCKYCEIYIADDAPSRTQHETGLRHQGNKERFIRNLYKNGEKKKRDEEEEKRELARIDQAANVAFANDVQSGRAKASTSSAPAISAKPGTSKPALSGGVYANYTTAKDLGIQQDEERIATEALQLQQSQGVVGQWEVIESAPSASLPALLPQKRSLDDEDEEGHGFRVQRRKLAEGLGEVYDPGKIIIAPKKGPTDEANLEEKEGEMVAQEQPKVLKWSTKRWKVGGGEEDDEEAEPVEDTDATVAEKENPKGEVANGEPITSPLLETKTEQPPDEGPAEVVDSAPSKSMFKKRKAPSQPVGQKKGVRRQL